MWMCANGKKNKEENNMVVIKLEDLEQRVKKNSSSTEKMINNFQNRLEKRGLKKGRVRPKNIIEQKILHSFKRK